MRVEDQGAAQMAARGRSHTTAAAKGLCDGGSCRRSSHDLNGLPLLSPLGSQRGYSAAMGWTKIGLFRCFHPMTFTQIAGPCVIESRDLALQVAEQVKAITGRLGIRYVFKASFDKANRSSGVSYRRTGVQGGLAVLAEFKQQFGLPVLTDIQESQQAAAVADVVEVLQIPAFFAARPICCWRPQRPLPAPTR